MAKELDPARLKCDAGHGRPVVGFAAQGSDGVPALAGWFACCPICLVDLAPYDHFVYVRIGGDHDGAGDGHDSINDLKPDDPGADNNGP